MSLFGPTITLSSTTSTGIYSAKTILSTSSHLSAISSSVYQRGTAFHSTLSPKIFLSSTALSAMTTNVMLSASTSLVLKTATLSFASTNTYLSGSTLSVTAATMHLSASTALTAYYSNIYLSASTSISVRTASMLLSAGTSLNLHGGTALSMKAGNLILSASGAMNYYAASSLSFTYATGATYNFFPIATATANSNSYSETLTGGPYAGIKVTRSGTTIYELETHTFTLPTMYNNGYCIASWNTFAYDTSNYYSWQISASCSSTQMIGYLHWNTGDNTNDARTNTVTGAAYTIFLVQ